MPPKQSPHSRKAKEPAQEHEQQQAPGLSPEVGPAAVAGLVSSAAPKQKEGEYGDRDMGAAASKGGVEEGAQKTDGQRSEKAPATGAPTKASVDDHDEAPGDSDQEVDAQITRVEDGVKNTSSEPISEKDKLSDSESIPAYVKRNEQAGENEAHREQATDSKAGEALEPENARQQDEALRPMECVQEETWQEHREAETAGDGFVQPQGDKELLSKAREEDGRRQEREHEHDDDAGRRRRERKRPRLILSALPRDERDAAAADAEGAGDVGPSTTAAHEHGGAHAPPEKKRRRGPGGALGMMSLLQSTLSKARTEAETASRDKGAKQRASLEARLATKLARENEQMRSASEEKSQLRALFRVAEDIAAGEAEHRSLRAQKRRLASFLVTKNPAAAATDSSGKRGPGPRAGGGRSQRGADVRAAGWGRVGGGITSSPPRRATAHCLPNDIPKGAGSSISADVPSSLPPEAITQPQSYSSTIASTSSALPRPGSMAHNEHHSTYQVYYLPKKLLAWQEDALDDQEDAVDDAIEDADDAWAARRKKLEEELKQLLEKVGPWPSKEKSDGERRGACDDKDGMVKENEQSDKNQGDGDEDEISRERNRNDNNDQRMRVAPSFSLSP
ncbi:hypothetical protein K437DRAFT_255984 [Tilletiaria anomala UBC 951]|uniref:Pinin/SDK/MemA protein domain-containing protein n=1 Tax=Tilletiaria anomala (strain ATCC 24038 / CBS 436.72 / UBC 951) TaxID=1037660 RepID=A0A066VZR4_TILAU|nr:uncharacterized protein K437DRAFT_255984 [Tilletiaria anomala UBC 951]KDN46966.1 hypothetical protein K437DRAFT_255984 [Tilletiaria anomala UBC 951]